MSWLIWCRVSGGITGTREAYLKSNGKIKVFPDQDSAEREAARLNEEMNKPPRTADFRYQAVEGTPLEG